MDFAAADTLINALSLLGGGGIGVFFTLRYMRRKSRAEAAIEEQKYYQEMVDDIAKDRDYYKRDRDEVREQVDKLTHDFMDWRLEADNDRSKMKMEITRLGQKVESMRPFMCGDLACKKRRPALISPTEESEITPYGPRKAASRNNGMPE